MNRLTTTSLLLTLTLPIVVAADDITLSGVSNSFAAASGIPSADIALVISVLLFVSTSIYASVKGITLSVNAVRQGSAISLLIGLILVGCIFVMIGSLL